MPTRAPSPGSQPRAGVPRAPLSTQRGCLGPAAESGAGSGRGGRGKAAKRRWGRAAGPSRPWLPGLSQRCSLPGGSNTPLPLPAPAAPARGWQAAPPHHACLTIQSLGLFSRPPPIWVRKGHAEVAGRAGPEPPPRALLWAAGLLPPSEAVHACVHAHS